MCEFCLKHGEGKKWYLEAKNYSADLASDVERRNLLKMMYENPEAVGKAVGKAESLQKLPKFVREWFVFMITRKQKKMHYGQVVPIEDVEKIFNLTNSIVRVACYCRYNTLGKEKRYCYGISVSPETGLAEILGTVVEGFDGGPYTSGAETLTREEALEAFRRHEREGLAHTIWTFGTPFIGGVCNCDRSDCWAMRFTLSRNMPMMFRAEYVGQIDPDVCNGCRECMRQCQFGALTWSASNKKAVIDQRWCYGCGVCRAVCKENAIALVDRAQVPVAANLW
ncbi:MAG: 4Fe-4S binding protein [Terriglobia bacterium]|nr:4Fe-4S binding protein [Terriglobia bacterium]